VCGGGGGKGAKGMDGQHNCSILGERRDVEEGREEEGGKGVLVDSMGGVDCDGAGHGGDEGWWEGGG